MTDLQQKQLAFLDETANHFNLSNRATACPDTMGSCIYSPVYIEGKRVSDGCAIGRKLPISLAALLDSEYGVIDSDVFKLLPKELQDLKMEFLSDVQDLHDNPNFWNEAGLSDKGKARYEVIKNYINDQWYS